MNVNIKKIRLKLGLLKIMSMVGEKKFILLKNFNLKRNTENSNKLSGQIGREKFTRR